MIFDMRVPRYEQDGIRNEVERTCQRTHREYVRSLAKGDLSHAANAMRFAIAKGYDTNEIAGAIGRGKKAVLEREGSEDPVYRRYEESGMMEVQKVLRDAEEIRRLEGPLYTL